LGLRAIADCQLPIAEWHLIKFGPDHFRLPIFMNLITTPIGNWQSAIGIDQAAFFASR
jgi:hypothetical protein